MKIRVGLLTAMACSLPTIAVADSCLPFLTRQDNTSVVQMVSLNNKGVGSSASGQVNLAAGIKLASGVVRPATWATGSTKANFGVQLFSDRIANQATAQAQPYNQAQSEPVRIAITVEESPEVTVMFVSYSVKAVFKATCSSNGVLHGSTTDTDYLLTLHGIIVQ